jgi:hypothetical protein
MSEQNNTIKERIKISPKLEDILNELYITYDNYLALEISELSRDTRYYFNGLRITYVDVSKVKTCFRVNNSMQKKPQDMRIDKFLKYYFKYLSQNEISEFVNLYSQIVSDGKVSTPSKNFIKIDKYTYNPKDVKNTFLSLVSKTYPYGTEEGLLQYLPKLNKDQFGNYYKIIGNNKPQTMFCCHLDTADRVQSDVNLLIETQSNGDEIILTDGKSILGADDKAGVVILMYMMDSNVPGLYYFFIGEERGTIGSSNLVGEIDNIDYLKEIKRCISFDRRDVCSIITSQLGGRCCSNEFGTQLSKEYSKYGIQFRLDPTGIYTDSANFMDDIGECTNLSVGYYNEHTSREKQNITFLEKICKASVGVDWNSLPNARKVGLDSEVYNKYKDLIKDIKNIKSRVEVKVIGEDEKSYIRCNVEDGLVEYTYDLLCDLRTILYRHKIDQVVHIEGDFLKIELKK